MVYFNRYIKTLTQLKATFETKIKKLSSNFETLRQKLLKFTRILTGIFTHDMSLLTNAYKDINFMGYKHRILNQSYIYVLY